MRLRLGPWGWVVVLVLVPVVAVEAAVGGSVAKAERALARGEVEEARGLYEKALARAPQDCEIHLGLALLDQQTGELEDAFNRLRLVEGECGAPRWHARALALQAALLIDQFRHRARQEVLASMTLDAPYGAGEIDLAGGVRRRVEGAPELALAEEALDQATALAGVGVPELWLQQAKLFELRRKWAEAGEAFKEYSRLRPREAAAEPLGNCLRFRAGIRPGDTVLRRAELQADAANGKPPRKTAGTHPTATAASRRAGIQGEVVVEGIVTRGGEVTCVVVLQDLPFGLGDTVADTLRSWLFEPAMIEGEPVNSEYSLMTFFRPR